jgi:hypothetical protein
MAGTKVTADVITDGSITAAKLAPGVGGTIWQSTPKTSDFTAVSGEGYFIDTTSSAVTVTLPSSPSVGDSVSIVDQGGSASSNAIVLASANKIQNSTDNKEIVVSNISINVVYSGVGKGWLVYSAANESASVLADPVIQLRALLVGAGGGGGSGYYIFGGNYRNTSGGGGGAGEFLDKPNIVIETGSNYTVSVGAGGAQNTQGGSTSMIADSGASNTFDYEVFGGGRGGHWTPTADGATGGSSGGGGFSYYSSGGNQYTAGGSVNPTKNEGDLGSRAFTGGSASGGYSGASGGGGGAGEAGYNASGSTGGNGGDGFQSDITGTNTYYAGGGAGAARASNIGSYGYGGQGGGGRNAAGTANTGGGGGGRASTNGSNSAYAGGSGIIILKYPDSLTISETTSPNVLTMSTDNSSVSGFKITSITAGTNGTIQFN